MGWIVKIILLSFVVGVLLSVFDINPASIVTNTWTTVREIGSLVAGAVEWALPYILLGAVIVVPLALVSLVLRWSRARRDP